MNKRSRLLAFGALGAAGLLIAGFAIRAVVLRPLRTLDDQIVQLRLRLRSLDGERKSFLAADSQIRSAAGTLFGGRAEEAEAQLGTLLSAQLLQAGLQEPDFSRVPASRRRLPGAEEIGWTVQGEGTPAQLVDFLYLLQAQPRLLRIDSLMLTPASDPRRVRIRFRCLTLVLNPASEVRPRTNLAAVTLDSPERRRYDAIIRRDLLRPFEPEEQNAVTSPSTTSDPGTGEASSLKLVSLSAWGVAPEAHVLDTRNQQIRILHPGDSLLDGSVATIDYRPLPAPGRAGLLSYSRLLWRFGEDYWAVENGQTLAERRRLAPEELPPALPRPATAPTQP